VNRYIALIGDIINSRKLQKRDQVQLKLQAVLEKINSRYKQYIVSKFVITIGDELQGLLVPGAPVCQVTAELLEEMYPVKLRFGLGHGELATRHINTEMALGMDGPAFYLAREAVEAAHESKGYSIVLRSAFLSDQVVDQINVTLGLLCVIRNLWNDKFLQIIHLLRAGKKQTEVAEEIGVTQPYISELVSRACWKEVKKLEIKAEELLKLYLERQKSAGYK